MMARVLVSNNNGPGVVVAVVVAVASSTYDTTGLPTHHHYNFARKMSNPDTVHELPISTSRSLFAFFFVPFFNFSSTLLVMSQTGARFGSTNKHSLDTSGRSNDS